MPAPLASITRRFRGLRHKCRRPVLRGNPLYQTLKDFAGPVATIIASITAALITWFFALRQIRVAKQQADTAKEQADTALDQLRFNLFERRVAIYEDTKTLIRHLVNTPRTETISASDVVRHTTSKIARFVARTANAVPRCPSWSLVQLRQPELKQWLGGRSPEGVQVGQQHRRAAPLIVVACVSMIPAPRWRMHELSFSRSDFSIGRRLCFSRPS